MGKINILDFQVANLIAAGEVVDRPASVIKELMENSIDAGATQVTVEIKNGGISLMRVTDNGCGMTADDLPLSVKRHATSKIHSETDLDAIVTLGFRGEALAAVSSVSRLRIISKPPGSDNGTLLVCESGEITEISETGCPTGTTVIVEELFSNVPARRKFLKRDVSETAAVTAAVEKIALSRPDISVRYITDGALRFSTAGDGKLYNCVYAVLGREFSSRLIEVNDMTDGVEIHGYIGAPDNNRGNRNYQNFFINGRFVKCATAAAALEQGYRSYIAAERFPVCVLNIFIHPALVDVNVHPAKLEVKFSNDRPVFNAVYCAVQNALASKVTDRELDPVATRRTSDDYSSISALLTEKFETAEAASSAALTHELLTAKREQLTLEDLDQNSTSPKSNPPDVPERTISELNVQNITIDTKTAPDGQRLTPPDSVTKTFGQQFAEPVSEPGTDMHQLPKPISESETNGRHLIPDDTGKVAAAPSPDSTAKPARPFSYRIAGVAFDCYIFVELDDKMLVIDKHAAHERIIFEEMKIMAANGEHSSQIMLVPLPITLSASEFGAVCEHGEEFKSLGFDYVIDSAAGRISLIERPSMLDVQASVAFFTEFAARLADGASSADAAEKELYERALYQASCKAAIKAGRHDSDEHIKWLCEQLLSLQNIKVCPHGRPVCFEMSKSSFEHQFKRT